MPTSKSHDGTSSNAFLLDPVSTLRTAPKANRNLQSNASRSGLQNISSARALLDPRSMHGSTSTGSNNSASTSRASAARIIIPQASAKINNPSSSKKDDEGIGSLIERLYGVSSREARPRKRPRTGEEGDADGATTSKKSTPMHNSSGEFGQYMKDQARERLKHTEPLKDLIDLTSGLEALHDTTPHVEDSTSQEVCYGRIQGAKVNAHMVPTPSNNAVFLGNDWPVMKVTLHRASNHDVIIRVADPNGKDFGNVDVRTAAGLARIMDFRQPGFRTQAKLLPRKRLPNEKAGEYCSQYLELAINLYGPRDKAVQIGTWLSQKQLWLRAPMTSDVGIEIVNPHVPSDGRNRTTGANGSFAGISKKFSSPTSYVSRTVEEIRNEVHGMFDTLQNRPDSLIEAEPDPIILTPLLQHQRQGLHFLQAREEPIIDSNNSEKQDSLWRLQIAPNGKRSYYNVISGQEELTKPSESRGGILADMMGLGKTLSILALIVGSLKTAMDFAKLPPPKVDSAVTLVRNSKATLLIAPLSTLNNWEDQIASHIAPGGLSYYIYHGPNRESNSERLADYDLIITTYAIASSDFSNPRSQKKGGSSPLFETNFFRIVLDEAHMIREQRTRQSLAACALSAERRWAVTGTPVQNRLDDLGALIKFLRVRPFSDKGGFAQYILAPFKNADPDILPKLRLLVDSLTLRRLKDRIDLPPKHDQIVRLEFNSEEAQLYDWFSTDSINRMNIITSNPTRGLGGKTYAHILRAIMRLRLICAHGKELMSEDDMKLTRGMCPDDAIDLDDGMVTESSTLLTAKQAYEMFMLSQEAGTCTCCRCTKSIAPCDSQDYSLDDVFGSMLPCYQILCPDCASISRKHFEEAFLHQRQITCPFCSSDIAASLFDLTKSGVAQADESRALARNQPQRSKASCSYGGPHTKVKALLENLRQIDCENDMLPRDEPPIKAVVFSGWTSYLDLIEIALKDEGIKFARLDGRMSRKARNEALSNFRTESDVRVMLISIMAGGLGLNLTNASRVFVMEPQFNPAAELQAVDRVHRLGQTRAVHTYRFIMKDSFEEKMLEVQRKKQNLAELSMNRGKLDKAEAAKRKLDELRSLFR